MRKEILWNEGWRFSREDIGAKSALEQHGESISLPHTWNAVDGQDGGNDYHRGVCWYSKEFVYELSDDTEVFVEFQGAAMVAEVYLNGKKITSHKGGYSTFRADITDALQKDNVLSVSVGNEYRTDVYPQKADFTFYGGIYRDVKFIEVPKQHFALDYFGGKGLKVTPQIEKNRAEVLLEAWTTNVPDGTEVSFSIENVGKVSAEVRHGKAEAMIAIENVRLWHGLDDPYLYHACAEMVDDEVTSAFGCRTFSFDKETGFYLNGKAYPLIGAARHQDRQGVGSALTKAMHDEDMEIMLDMGLNTARLAHYQHDQYFYDLCDEKGVIVWAEIPYITEHMPTANENSISQMTELVVQNYNHPSVVTWGLSNEISATGGVNDDMVENHKKLNELCHSFDKTRPTTMAHVFMLETSNDFVKLPDIMSYNLYYGWYIGELDDNDRFFDDFHRDYPEMTIGLSEFGADANPAYQSASPYMGDLTEGYQALYHEHMLKMRMERPYIWAMHVWNMFDFGADGRNEGGKPGQNQKGLVTFDRKLKKDAYYIYKAYLSKMPFVHICGRRYVDRTEDVTEIKVYSNRDEVTLFVDGNETVTVKGDKIFKFSVPISGKHVIKAVSGDVSDEIEICKADKPNPDYRNGGGEVVNWFDREDEIVKDGFYSIKDSMGSLKANPDCMAVLAPMMERAARSFGDVAQNVTMPESMQKLMDKAPLENMLRQVGKAVPPSMVKEINAQLNKIAKPQ